MQMFKAQINVHYFEIRIQKKAEKTNLLQYLCHHGKM